MIYILIIFLNFYCIFDQIKAVLLSRKDFTHLYGSVNETLIVLK